MTFQPYLEISRDRLLKKIASQMSEERFNHILRVEEAALELAQRYGCDETKASLAALLHDYAKECSDQEFLDLIETHHLDKDLRHWNNNIWHGKVGIYKIIKDFNLRDPEILRAIEIHTVGAPEMTLLDKVLYVADYIEKGRDFPVVNQARTIAQTDLDKAVAFETAHTIMYLASKAAAIYPQTLETYNAYCHYLKENKS
ncbi:bis(5'-nucleosyl)-tetraphosphatase (symmetrical) YqeK [Streptococcus halichoeri]|uniref:bis(5'-nucleosyl)-tetraphosphatase (symmetrical) YqeK n=1 Tax=Streptococcus halichoeri TaxID=254785 RepID=UPI00135739C0|nr:bis(5'-nucleosyl)-tetraphosphatase (symmetrical) YqeK [Streptococcus halichoeri]